MYTVEFSHDLTRIITLDQAGQFSDVEVVLNSEGTVFLTQHDDEYGTSDIIVLSYQQLLDIAASLDSTEGLFKLKLRRE